MNEIHIEYKESQLEWIFIPDFKDLIPEFLRKRKNPAVSVGNDHNYRSG